MLLIRHDDHLHISEGDDFCSKESNDEKWVTLNVGGKLFTTTSMALTAKEPFSMLARMFAADSGSCSSSPSCRDTSGAYLIDQSPTYFEPILNFLRHGKLILDEGVNPEDTSHNFPDGKSTFYYNPNDFFDWTYPTVSSANWMAFRSKLC